MIIELIQQGSPLVVAGNPIAKGNMHIDYRLKNVPAERIKHVRMRRDKQRWDDMLRHQSKIAHAFKVYAKKYAWDVPSKNATLAMGIRYYFESQTHKIASMIKKDLDNCQKLTCDGIEKSGIILDDAQICYQIASKHAVPKGDGCLVVYSFAVLTDGEKDFEPWVRGCLENAEA